MLQCPGTLRRRCDAFQRSVLACCFGRISAFFVSLASVRMAIRHEKECCLNSTCRFFCSGSVCSVLPADDACEFSNTRTWEGAKKAKPEIRRMGGCTYRVPPRQGRRPGHLSVSTYKYWPPTQLSPGCMHAAPAHTRSIDVKSHCASIARRSGIKNCLRKKKATDAQNVFFTA